MKLVDFKCPNCESGIKADTDSRTATCEYCGSAFAIDDESLTVNVNLSCQEEAGYQFEKGRQRAQAESKSTTAAIKQTPPQKKRKTWLWVLGWIFVFPIPLSILMLNSPKTKNIDSRARIGIVVVGWLIYLAIGLSGVGGGSTTTTNATTGASVSDVATAAHVQSDDRGGYANVDTFIDRFNATSDTPITEAKEVDNIADKSSDYYRTEYRLGAFKDAVGVVGQIEGYGQIDIVSYGSTGYTDIRVYADVQNKEQAAVMFENLANVLVSGKDRDNIAQGVENIKTSSTSNPNLYLGTEYSASYLYDEVYIEAKNVKFE